MGSNGSIATVPTRTQATTESYLKRGRAIADKAEKLFPRLSWLDALRARCADETWVLRASSVRTYKAAIITFVEAEVEAGRCDVVEAAQALPEIVEFLAARRGQPEPRTSRKKLKYATPEQVDAIVTDLTHRRLENPDPLDDILQHIFELGPVLGVRPGEWPSAAVEGRSFAVRNAKHSNGRAPAEYRIMSLKQMSDETLFKLKHLTDLIQDVLKADPDWSKLHKAVSERLARICERLGLPRLSVYSLRHTAIGTWKRAKLSREEIAAMSGHVSVRTASRHYAPARRGWSPESVCVSAHKSSIAAFRSAQSGELPRSIAEPRELPAGWGGFGLAPI